MELLLVIGIIATTAGIAIPMYRQYQVFIDIDTATEHLVQASRAAQALSQAGKYDSVWGVNLRNGTLFAGESYIERNPNRDVSFPLPSTVATDWIDEITFSRVDGLPSVTGVFCVYSLIANSYRAITIDVNGILSVSAVLHNGCNVYDHASAATGTTGGGTGGSSGEAVGTCYYTTDDTIENQEESDNGAAEEKLNNDCFTCEDTLLVDTSTNTLTTKGISDMTVSILGSAITYGPSGPRVDVTVEMSMDGGTTWQYLNGGSAIAGNATQIFSDVLEDSNIVFRVNGRYSWLFNKTYTSNVKDDHTYILQDGDSLPPYDRLAQRSSLQSFLQPYVDTDNTISLGAKEAILLFELSPLDQKTSDFQDAAILVSFTPNTSACTAVDEPRVSISFRRLENIGNGDLEKRVFVGNSPLEFHSAQWIPLKNTAGTVIVDPDFTQGVHGIAVERGNGWIRIISEGKHIANNNEIADLKVRFLNAYIDHVDNGVSKFASENPTNGIISDNDSGDEFIDGMTAKSMFFYTRVKQDYDEVTIYWTTETPASSSPSSAPPGVYVPHCSVDMAEQVAYWRFEESPSDYVPNEYGDAPMKLLNGAVLSTSVLSLHSENTKSGLFDGVNATGSASTLIPFTTAGTVSFYFKPEDVSNAGRSQYLFHSDAFIDVVQEGRNLLFSWRDSQGGPSLRVDGILTSADVGKWKHVVMTNNNGLLTAYLNGVQIGQNSEGKLNRTIRLIYVGGDDPTTGSLTHFTGHIDELRIFTSALSASDVVRLESYDCMGATTGTPPIDECSVVPYTLSTNGTVTLQDDADLLVRVIGSDSTLGDTGPRIDIKNAISFNTGLSWEDLFNGAPIRGGETTVFRNVLAGSRIDLSFKGTYSWSYNTTVKSGESDNRLRTLLNGQPTAGLSELISSGQASVMLRSLTNADGWMQINDNEVAYLLELNDPDTPTFKDAIVILSVNRPDGTTCSSSSPPADTDNDTVLDPDDWCPLNTAMPEQVPTEYMSFGRLALTEPLTSGVNFREGPNRIVSEYTLARTHGCSCTQILDAIEGRGTHTFDEHPILFQQMKSFFQYYLDSARKYGCSNALIKMVADEDPI